MKFPYGISDFYSLMTEGYFYVDRTDRIPLLEELGKQLVFLRPRRFGKSLLLSTLENYYDVARADQFEQLFGPLAVGRNPTPRRNQYFVLKWDFSVVDPQGETREIKRALHNHLNNSIRFFAARYSAWLPAAIEVDPNDAISSFGSTLSAVRQSPHRLYLLIDEYDNFANEVMMSAQAGSRQRYEALLHGEGALKTLFKAVKSATTGGGLDRVFITGVSPIVLADMTSGYNIAENVSLLPELHDLCGFTEAEVADTLQAVATDCRLPAERAVEALAMMRAFYDGYRFAYEAADLVYNSTLALYFLKHWQRYCRYPEEMLDSNLAMDRNRLAYIVQLPGGGQLVHDAVAGDPPVSVDHLSDRFSLDDMLREDKEANFNASLLYYLGVLTLGGRIGLNRLVLTIPNLVVRRLYVERLLELILPDRRDHAAPALAAETFFQSGDLQPLCDLMERRYFKALANRDYRRADELLVKVAFLTLLFHDRLYIVDSEPALSRGYADLTLIVRPELRHLPISDFLFEFKYVSLSEAGLSGEAARQLSATQVRALPAVQAKLTEARARLVGYRQAFAARYGHPLRLRVYAVVALGFERLAWEETT
jgi:hypothetical protein